MISSVGFERHKENPLDSLNIGRIQERREKAFKELVVKIVSDLNDLSRDYPEVRCLGHEPILPGMNDVFGEFTGIKIQLNISTFPLPSQEKIYHCVFEYYIETGITRMRWYNKTWQEEMNKFGQYEEVKLAFADWLKQYCYKRDDQRRFQIRYM